MPSKSPNMREVARRLLTGSGGSTGLGQGILDSATGAEQAFRMLALELSRWFGFYGYHSLLTRALAEARKEHPVLATVQVRSATEPWFEPFPVADGTHGVNAAIEGWVALLTALLELLGRVIGEDLAVKLVSQGMTKRAPDDQLDVAPDQANVTEPRDAP
jgi:hypothetical protein